MSYFCHCPHFTQAYLEYKIKDEVWGGTDKNCIWIHRDEMLKLRKEFDEKEETDFDRLDDEEDKNYKNYCISEFKNFVIEKLHEKLKNINFISKKRVQFTN